MSGLTKKKDQFVGDFGGYSVIEDGQFYLYVPEKQVYVNKNLLMAAVKEINDHPINTKLYVGHDRNYKPMFMWRDSNFTYIGCLSELTTDFNKKYQKLIKHLKQ